MLTTTVLTRLVIAQAKKLQALKAKILALEAKLKAKQPPPETVKMLRELDDAKHLDDAEERQAASMEGVTSLRETLKESISKSEDPSVFKEKLRVIDEQIALLKGTL